MNVFRKSALFRKNTSKKGASLLELLIAIVIFVIIMIATVDIFVNMASARAEFDRVRESHEKAQIAMESLAKSLRSGVVISPTTKGSASSIRIYDYSQGACIQYNFNASNNTLTRSVRKIDRDLCTSSINLGTLSTLTSGDVNGEFYIIPSDAGADEVGLVHIRARLFNPDNPSESNTTRIQTTVSMRNIE